MELGVVLGSKCPLQRISPQCLFYQMVFGSKFLLVRDAHLQQGLPVLVLFVCPVRFAYIWFALNLFWTVYRSFLLHSIVLSHGIPLWSFKTVGENVLKTEF